ncbi:ceramide-1-phosphate transfer protein [Trichonephila inaurata madagascariensis]|uniref:Ceramide-1-phosphate transfer protein n=1 Tax=Trichonephila inaurata madagascariensis TaxID=2747483 RepID=A0A8X7CNR2_9ARAC|nr:ceramide-1-phosphate transfer protein [Trichonephila inaurata madagascariensis]
MENENVTNKINEENIAEKASDQFDIQLLYNSLEKCCKESNALDMEQYLIAFKELYRFFTLLGSVFGFVASDIISKVTILEEYKKSDASDQYATIQSMIEYETCNGITGNTSQPSGSRTLLRLHRSLEFIMSFMNDFSCADIDAKSSTIAQKCYNETLSKYHPWLIRKGATIAMYTLPAKQQFIERVYGSPCDEAVVQFYAKMMGDIAGVSKKVFDETHKLYEANDLLNLP